MEPVESTSHGSRGDLTIRILIAMIAACATGIALNQWFLSPGTAPPEWFSRWLTDGLFYVGGQTFLRLLMMLVVPMVFVSLVCGTAALDDVKRLGRIGAITLFYYLGSTAVAVSTALLAAVLVQPGQGISLPTEAAYQAKSAPPLAEVLIELVPANPLRAMTEGAMLPVIVFAILFGLALSLCGEAGKRLQNIFEDLNTVILKLIDIVMLVAPVGVFCLVARTFTVTGLAGIQSLGAYFALVLAVLFWHGLVFYPLCLQLLGGLPAWPFLKKMRTVWMVAFSTASSNATLPVNLETAEQKLGISKRIASFLLPLGATINMDGTAIMQGVATVFIAQVFQVDLSLTDLLTVVATATLASIGTAGVPGVGLVMLAMVLQSVGLPLEGIALITGIDRLLDMTRTCVNVTGDATFACIVARQEKELDETVFLKAEKDQP